MRVDRGRGSADRQASEGARLGSAAKAVDFAAIALGRFSFAPSFEARRGFALLGQLLPERAACFRLAVKGLRDRRGAAHFAEGEDFDLENTAVVLHL